jgi:hypothetical protein
MEIRSSLKLEVMMPVLLVQIILFQAAVISKSLVIIIPLLAETKGQLRIMVILKAGI